MKAKIVFSDIDGTFLTNDHRVTEQTEKAVKSLLAQNIPFVVGFVGGCFNTSFLNALAGIHKDRNGSTHTDIDSECFYDDGSTYVVYVRTTFGHYYKKQQKEI